MKYRFFPTVSQRLDTAVAAGCGVSRQIARRSIRMGQVWVNGRAVKVLAREVHPRQCIECSLEDSCVPAPKRISAPAYDVDIVYMDDALVVLNKPVGLLSEPDRFAGPYVEQVLLRRLAKMGETRRKLWLLHRLDAGTSGLLVLARRAQAARSLYEAFAARRVHKHYWALCQGVPRVPQTIDLPIARLEGTRHGVHASGRPAQTRIERVISGENASAVWLAPLSGRTHQLRVHMSALGHPLLGDKLYGGWRYTPQFVEPIARVMLHAAALSFTHPVSGKEVSFSVAPPADFLQISQHFHIMLESF